MMTVSFAGLRFMRSFSLVALTVFAAIVLWGLVAWHLFSSRGSEAA